MTSLQGPASESRGLLAPLAVAALFAAALLLALRQAGERGRELKRLSAEKGWAYSRLDPGGVKERLEELFPEQRFRLENVMTVEAAAGRTTLFECGAHWKGWNSVSFWSGGLRESPSAGAGGPPVEIFPRVALADRLEADTVEIGDEEFSRLFVVASKDAGRARRVANPRLRAALLAQARRGPWTPQRVNIAGGRIVVLAGPNYGAGVFPEILELLQALEGALK